MMADHFSVAPLPDGVRLLVDDRVLFRPYTPQQLLDMGIRFIEAAKEAMRPR